MKKNIGKADISNRMFMIPLLLLAAYFTAGWLRYIFGAIALYEIYTVLTGNCLVYQMMNLSSADKPEGKTQEQRDR
jgi:hypothetical protein